MTEPYERQPVFIIKDLETLKVMADPLRIQIIESLAEEPQTVKYVADQLGMTSNRLYYHFNMLESTGLIQVVRTQTVNNIIEKFYWTAAKEIMVDQDIVKTNPDIVVEEINRMIVAALDATKEDIIQSLRALKDNFSKEDGGKPNEISAVRKKKRLKDEDFENFSKRFKELMEEFQALPEANTSDPDAKVYSIAYFLYPSMYYENEDKDGKENEK